MKTIGVAAHHVAHVPVQVVVVNAGRTLELLGLVARDPEADLRGLQGSLKDLETAQTTMKGSQPCKEECKLHAKIGIKVQ